MGLHHLFKAAYECQPVPSYGSGTNLMPMVHVDDLATYCLAVVEAKPAQQYLLVVDDGQITQSSLIKVFQKPRVDSQPRLRCLLFPGPAIAMAIAKG